MAGSPFKIGKDVELWRVVAYLSALVVLIMFCEVQLHHLGHKLKAHPKYQEMLSKVFGELMILGFLGLLAKLLKELGGVDPYDPAMVAFQAADLIVFILAIGLILQALFMYLRLRRKNIQVEKAELISSQDLCDVVEHYRNTKKCCGLFLCGKGSKGSGKVAIRPSDFLELIQLRLLRHYFLKSYGLPELFPFSKYLRQAQDNQITHMIEVEMSTWIMLLGIAWGLEGVSKLIYEAGETKQGFSIVLAFQGLSWFLVVLHILTLVYLEWGIRRLRRKASEHAGEKHRDRLECLKEVARQENETVDHEIAMDAIARMEHVREREQKKKVKRSRFFLTRHDTGFQLVAMICRNLFYCLCCCFRKKKQSIKSAGNVDEDAMETGASNSIQLSGFSRKVWHFVVMSLLMINGFFFALFCQCIAYQYKKIYDDNGVAPLVFTPLPILINWILLQPRIIRTFIVISSITRVDDKALADVIEHFMETVQLRSEFVNTLTANLEQTNRSIDELMSHFTKLDRSGSGFVEIEDARLILRGYGFELSFFRFNSVAKLLFTLNGTQLEYAQIKSLLELGLQEPIRLLYGERMIVSNGTESSTTAQYPTSVYVDPHLGAPQNTLKKRPGLSRASSSAAHSLYHLNSQASQELRRDQHEVTSNYVQM
ncbi:Atp-dependent RNA helicase dbp4, partial [Globisporangium splendens]